MLTRKHSTSLSPPASIRLTLSLSPLSEKKRLGGGNVTGGGGHGCMSVSVLEEMEGGRGTLPGGGGGGHGCMSVSVFEGMEEGERYLPWWGQRGTRMYVCVCLEGWEEGGGYVPWWWRRGTRVYVCVCLERWEGRGWGRVCVSHTMAFYTLDWSMWNLNIDSSATTRGRDRERCITHHVPRCSLSRPHIPEPPAI